MKKIGKIGKTVKLQLVADFQQFACYNAWCQRVVVVEGERGWGKAWGRARGFLCSVHLAVYDSCCVPGFAS